MVVSTGDIWLSPRLNNEAPKAWSFFKLLDLDAGDAFFSIFCCDFSHVKWDRFNVKGVGAKKQ